MGGKNHQPCNTYLRFSTVLSRELSAAQVGLEMANHLLEDVILAELDGCRGSSTVDICSQLSTSRAKLAGAQEAIGALRSEMHKRQFEDLPTLQTADLSELGLLLQARQMVVKEAWDRTVGIMKKVGFHGILGVFEQEIATIDRMTTELSARIAENELAADTGELNLVLEQNRQGNFKMEFARLYSKWATFQQFFLASSILSTELWYRFNGTGSLVEQCEESTVA